MQDNRKVIEIEVPVAAPLMNQFIRMPQKRQFALKEQCRQLLSASLTIVEDSPTRIRFSANGSSIKSLLKGYYLTTRQRSSQKSGTGK